MSFRLAPPRMKKWLRRTQTKAATFPVFDVWRFEMADGAGAQRPDVYCFHCPDWCNVVAVTENQEIVLVWQYRFGTDALSLEVPGGVIDQGESPLECARRELLEETGYEADDFRELIVLEANPALQNNRVYTFVAKNARRVKDTSFDEAEELETTLVPASALRQVLDEGHVTHALVHSALEAFLRKP